MTEKKLETMEPDDGDRAIELGKKLLEVAIQDEATTNIAQAAFSSAWVTICKAAQVSPDFFDHLTADLAQFYRKQCEEPSE